VKTRLILKAGRPGTKRLVEKYGDSLVCVRFKYDEAAQQRLKTVELIVERTKWTPPHYADDALVPVKIGYSEKQLMEAAKAAKGRWNPEARLWFIRYGKIKGTPLEKHIHIDK
jgi:hypothetical protein